MDEHDQPTEPMMPVFPAPSAPTVADTNIPASTFYAQPFPYQQGPTYPILPSQPASSSGVKQAGANANSEVANSTNRANTLQSKRSSFPLMVGMFFVAVQLLLLVRFVLKLLMFSTSIPWIGVLYTISSVFVWPFRLLLQSLPLSLPNSIELYTLLAILLYGLLSRLLVRFLKALFHSR